MVDELRSIRRYKTNRPAKISWSGAAAAVDCTIRDLSTQGARIEVQKASEIPNTFVLAVLDMSVRHRCRVAWRAEPFIGVSFE